MVVHVDHCGQTVHRIAFGGDCLLKAMVHIAAGGMAYGSEQGVELAPDLRT